MKAMRALTLSLLVSVSAPAAFAQEYSSQPYLAQIGVTSGLHATLSPVITNSAAASNVGIAILDGLADVKHVDLNRATVSGVYAGRFLKPSTHGTHVMGAAGAALNGTGVVGVNPFAKLYSIPVFDDRGAWVATDNGKLALDRANSLGAKVVNMSYGPTARGDVFLSGELNLFDDYLNSMVLVRAAGNTGVNALNETYAGDASVSLANLLIVGSVNASNQISTFSNRAGTGCIAATTTCAADDKISNFFIVARGETVYSDLPNNSYGNMSGTSMAAPQVSGAAALVFQNALAGNTLLTPAQVASILKSSATDLGAQGVDSVYGWGLLNVPKALGPVGTITVATTGTVGTNSVGTNSTSTSNATLRTASSMGRRGAFGNVLNGMVVFDSFGRGFAMNDVSFDTPQSTLADDAVSSLSASLLGETEVQENEAGRLALSQSGDAVSGYNAFSFATDGYSVSSGMGNAQAYFTQSGPAAVDETASRRLGTQFFTGAGEVGQSFATGFFSGADIAVSPGITFSALYAHGSEQVFDGQSDWTDANAEDASANDLVTFGSAFNMGEAGTLGVSFGLLREENAMLGIESDGAFSLGDVGYTQMVGLSYSRPLSGKFALDAFAQLGLTGTSGTSDTIFESVSDVWSTKMGLSLTGTGLLQKHDAMQLSLVSPWRIVEGEVEAQVAVGRELDGTVNYETRSASLAGGDMPLDLGLSYTVNNGDVSYGGSVWLRDSDVETVSVDEAVAAAGLSWRF